MFSRVRREMILLSSAMQLLEGTAIYEWTIGYGHKTLLECVTSTPWNFCYCKILNNIFQLQLNVSRYHPNKIDLICIWVRCRFSIFFLNTTRHRLFFPRAGEHRWAQSRLGADNETQVIHCKERNLISNKRKAKRHFKIKQETRLDNTVYFAELHCFLSLIQKWLMKETFKLEGITEIYPNTQIALKQIQYKLYHQDLWTGCDLNIKLSKFSIYVFKPWIKNTTL